MKVILDTHVFLWWNMNDPQLSETAKFIISDGSNEVYLSAASAWEIALKTNRGKLSLPESPDRYVISRLARHGFRALPIQLSHALAVYALPDYHRDPFDRLLVAQSRLEGMPILTADSAICRYEVDTVW